MPFRNSALVRQQSDVTVRTVNERLMIRHFISASFVAVNYSRLYSVHRQPSCSPLVDTHT